MASEGVQFGIFAPTFGSDPRHISKTARESGFNGVQFDAKSSSLDLLDLSSSGRREFRRILTSQDQQSLVSSMDTGSGGFSPGADVDREIDRLDRAMEAAAGLAAPLICGMWVRCRSAGSARTDAWW